NEDLSFYKRLRHNFGHVNTIEYNQSTDSLIFGNGSGFYDTDGEIYIIEGVKHWKNLERDPLLDINGLINGSRVIKIEVGRDCGDKVNVCWGEDNNGQNNICYVISNDAQNIRKLLLGKGQNNLGLGQFISGLTSNQFNGTYKIIGEWTTPKIDVVQGGCYYNGYLYLGIGHGGMWVVRYKLNDNGSVQTEQKLEKFYTETGDVIDCASEGVTIKDGMIYHNVLGGVRATYRYRVF